MKNILIALTEYLPAASAAEKSVIDYILNNTFEISNVTVKDLSVRCYVSQATIVRLCAKLGYSGYREFMQTFSAEMEFLRRTIRSDLSDISGTDSYGEIASKVTMRSIKSLEDTLHLIDSEELQQCVRLLERANTIGLFGVGACLVVARDAYIKFLRINKPCVFNDDWNNQILQANNLNGDDVAIVISYSGATNEVVECARILSKNGCPIISVTQNTDSPIVAMSTRKLYIPSNEGKLRSGAIASRMAQMNIMDILFTAYAYKTYGNLKQTLAETYNLYQKHRFDS